MYKRFEEKVAYIGVVTGYYPDDTYSRQRGCILFYKDEDVYQKVNFYDENISPKSKLLEHLKKNYVYGQITVAFCYSQPDKLDPCNYTVSNICILEEADLDKLVKILAPEQRAESSVMYRIELAKKWKNLYT